MHIIPEPKQTTKQSLYVLNKQYKQVINWRHQFANSGTEAKLVET